MLFFLSHVRGLFGCKLRRACGWLLNIGYLGSFCPININMMKLIAWWGAGLSTLLVIIKIFELWRDRCRIEVNCYSTSNESIGNDIVIRNLSSRPIILKYWELLDCSGHWPLRSFKSFDGAESDSGDFRLEPYATLSLRFANEDYFVCKTGRRILLGCTLLGESQF